MKKHLNFLCFLSILFLYGCGFEPIYLSKKSDFKIVKIETSKKNRLNSTITKYLKNISNSESTNYYEIKFNSIKEKKISSKDKKGNPQILTMIVSVNVEINNMSNMKKTKNFSEQFSYSNNSNKFSLSKYEKNIEKNLINKIISNITLFMLTLE